jgi:hypothetical protein
MSAAFTLQAEVRELSFREGDGIQVRLLWSPATDALSVSVTDIRTGESFEVDAPPAKALDVFEHPFAYAARVEYATAA